MLYRRRIILLAVIALASTSAWVKAEGPDHLKLVRAYADAMIEHGRDTYGKVYSPLFAATLDRKTLKLPRGTALPRVAGVRAHDRALFGANPMHDLIVKAIEVLVDSFERRRDPQTGAIPAAAGGESHYLWPTSNLSLAIDLHDCTPKVPQKLAAKMLSCARRVDEVYLKIPQDLGPDGEGFLVFADRTNLEPNPRYPGRPWTNTWAMRYGNPADAQPAMLCLLRYRQVKLDGYRKLFLDTAERYVRSEPDPSRVIWPGAVGDALAVLLNAHRFTGEQKYLDRADQLADKAVDIFFTDDSPLPKASSQNDHYEAITRPDTLAMELLDLWAIRNKPGLDLGLIWPER